MPDKVESAVPEYRTSDGFVVDIALMVANEPAAAIEIRVTHAVDENKADSLPIPFIELEGQKVIDNPYILEPIRDHFKTFKCRECKHYEMLFDVKVNEIAKQTGVELPNSYYQHGFCKCWKCGREIIVFSWPKKSEWDGSEPKVEPIPRTIQYRYSKTARSHYWVNTCPYCKCIQGDWFLFWNPERFCIPHGPSFSGLDMMIRSKNLYL